MYDSLLQTAIYNAVSPLLTAYQTSGTPRLYYLNAPPNTARPYATFQFQSDINTAHLISRGGAETLVLLKTWSDTLPLARAMRDVMAPANSYGVPALPTLTASGYSITSNFERSPQLPYDGLLYQVGHLFRVTLHKTPS